MTIIQKEIILNRFVQHRLCTVLAFVYPNQVGDFMDKIACGSRNLSEISSEECELENLESLCQLPVTHLESCFNNFHSEPFFTCCMANLSPHKFLWLKLQISK